MNDPQEISETLRIIGNELQVAGITGKISPATRQRIAAIRPTMLDWTKEETTASAVLARSVLHLIMKPYAFTIGGCPGSISQELLKTACSTAATGLPVLVSQLQNAKTEPPQAQPVESDTGWTPWEPGELLGSRTTYASRADSPEHFGIRRTPKDSGKRFVYEVHVNYLEEYVKQGALRRKGMSK